MASLKFSKEQFLLYRHLEDRINTGLNQDFLKFKIVVFEIDELTYGTGAFMRPTCQIKADMHMNKILTYFIIVLYRLIP